MAAEIGNGFRIYEVNSGDIVLDCKDAHQAEVNHLIPLYDGLVITLILLKNINLIEPVL